MQRLDGIDLTCLYRGCALLFCGGTNKHLNVTPDRLKGYVANSCFENSVSCARELGKHMRDLSPSSFNVRSDFALAHTTVGSRTDQPGPLAPDKPDR